MPIPSTRRDLLVTPRPNGNGVVVYDPISDTGHVLEGTTAAVFDACDGTVDRNDLLIHLAATDPSIDADTLDAALAEIDRAELFDGALTTQGGISRRVILGGLVAGAAAAALAPVITSVVRPRPAAAQVAIICDDKTATTIQDTAVDVTCSSTGTDTAYSVYWVVDPPTHGTVTVTNTSSGGFNTGAYMTYTPNPGYVGPDTFRYIVGECAAAPGSGYPAPQYAKDACPATTTIFEGFGLPGIVSVTVTTPPTTTTTTTAPDPSTPKYTG